MPSTIQCTLSSSSTAWAVKTPGMCPDIVVSPNKHAFCPSSQVQPRTSHTPSKEPPYILLGKLHSEWSLPSLFTFILNAIHLAFSLDCVLLMYFSSICPVPPIILNASLSVLMIISCKRHKLGEKLGLTKLCYCSICSDSIIVLPIDDLILYMVHIS